MALTHRHYRCNTVLMLFLASPVLQHTHTHTFLHTWAAFLWKLMDCVPRKTLLLKSWLGTDHMWCICLCVFEREGDKHISVLWFVFLVFICKLTHESIRLWNCLFGNCPADSCPPLCLFAFVGFVMATDRAFWYESVQMKVCLSVRVCWYKLCDIIIIIFCVFMCSTNFWTSFSVPL